MQLFKKKTTEQTKEETVSEETSLQLEKECSEAIAEIGPKSGLLQKTVGKFVSAETYEKISKAASLCALVIDYKKGEYTQAPINIVKAAAGAICMTLKPLRSKKILALLGFDVTECKSIWQECGHLVENDLTEYRKWKEEQKQHKGKI